MKEDVTAILESVSDEVLTVRELEGRIYFETLPILTVGAPVGVELNERIPDAVLGVRG